MFGLPQNTITEVQAIFTKYPSIEEAIIYGSRAKGDYKKGSDIDLTLKGSIANAELLNIIDELDESYIPYLFDVSIYNHLQSDSLKEHINSVGKVFYKKE